METDNTNLQVPPAKNIEQSQPVPLPNPSSHSKIFIIVLGIAFIAVIGIGGFMLGSKKNQTVVQQQITTSPTGSQPSPTPDETVYTEATRSADWKSYTNSKYKYSIQYPEDWFVLGPWAGQQVGEFHELCQKNPKDKSVVQFSKKDLESCGFIGELIPANEIDITIWVLDTESDIYNVLHRPKQIISIDGVPAVKYSRDEKSEYPDVNASRIYVNFDGKQYVFYLKQTDLKGGHDLLYDQILSTFKFLDQQQTGSKYCKTDNDCGLLACGGCFSREFLKNAPTDLPCYNFPPDEYTCGCIQNVCKETTK